MERVLFISTKIIKAIWGTEGNIFYYLMFQMTHRPYLMIGVCLVIIGFVVGVTKRIIGGT